MARAGTAYVSFDGDFGPLNRALAKKMGELKGLDTDIKLGVKVDRTSVRRAVAAVKAEVAGKDAKINVKVDYDRAAFRRLAGDANNINRGINKVAAGFDKFATVALGVVGAMSGLSIIFADVAIGATALVAALAPLVGLLGTIPAGIVGLGQVTGALVAGFSGVFDAIGKGNDAMKTHTKQTQALGAAQKSAANQIASAQESIRSANNNVRDSQESLSEAQKNARFVQGQLSVAQQEAKRDLEDLRFAAQRASDTYIDSTLNLAEAKKRLSEAQADPKSSQLQIEQLQQQVREAGHSQAEAAVNQRRAAQDNAKAQKAGVEGSDKVIAARKAITDANKQVLQSQRQVAEAQHEAARAQTSLADAQTASADASSKNTTATQNYLDALKDLSPAQRDFVKIIVGMSDKFKELRNEVGEAMFPGIVSGIKLAMRNWIPFKNAIVATGGAIGDVAEKFGKLLGDKRFGKNLTLISKSNIKVFEDLADAAVAIAEGMSDIGVAARPMVEAISGAIKDIADDFQRWAEAANNSGELTRFFEGTLSTLDKLWTIVKGLGGGIIGIITALQPFGDDMLTTLGGLATKFNEWANSTAGQARIKKFFEDAKPTIEAVAKAIGSIAKFIAQLSEHQAGLQVMFDLFAKTLGVVTNIIDKVPLIGELLTSAFGFAILRKLPVLSALGRITSEKSIGIFRKIGKTLTQPTNQPPMPPPIAGGAPGSPTFIPGVSAGAEAAGKAAGNKFKAGLNRTMRGAGVGLAVTFGGEFAASLVGETVGGDTGEKIKEIGSNAALWGGIGASVGTLVAPGIGTAVGAGIGALVGGFATTLKQHRPDLEKVTRDIIASMTPGGEVPLTTPVAGKGILDQQKRLRDAQKERANILETLPSVAPEQQAGLRAALAEQEKIIADAGKKIATSGQAFGDQYMKGWATGVSKHHAFWSSSGEFVKGAEQGLTGLSKALGEPWKDLPQQTKQAAIDQTVAYTRQLEHSGRVPVGTTKKLVDEIISKYHIIPSGLKKDAKGGVDNVNEQLKRRDVVNSAAKQSKELSNKYAGFPKDLKFAGNQGAKSFLTEIDWLKGQLDRKDVSKEYKANVRRDLKRVQGDFKTYTAGAGSNLDAGLIAMGVKGSKKMRETRQQIEKAFEHFSTGVGTTSGRASGALYSALVDMKLNADEILKALGIKPPQIKLTKAQKAGKGAVSGPVAAQRGWYVPGVGNGDTVPAMLEPGEYVLNKRAVSKLGKHRLDQINFRNAPRFRTGGLVTGDTDVLPALLTRLEKLAAAAGMNINITSGRRTLAEQAALYRSKGAYSGTHAGAAAPTPNAPHVRGIAADISPGASALGALAGRFGLSFPLGNEPWHIQLLDAGAKAVATAVEHVKHMLITGPDGVLKSSAQGLSNRAERAFNRYIDSNAADVSGVGGQAQGAEANVIAAFKRAIKDSGATKVERLALWEAGIVESGLKNLQYGDADSLGALQERTSVYGRSHALDPYASATRFLHDARGLRPWRGSAGNLAAALQRPAAQFRGRYDQVSGQARQYLQRGGIVGLMHMLQGGGLPTGPLSTLPTRGTGSNLRSVPIPTGSDVTSLLRQISAGTKKGKETKKSKHARDSFLRRINGLDLPQATKNALAKFAPQIDIFQSLADQADTVNNATTADKIKDAVQERTNRLGRKMNPDELAAFVGPMLQTVSGPGGKKGNPIYWMTQKVVAMGQWRNALINVAQSVKGRVDQWSDALNPLTSRKERLEKSLKLENGKKKKDASKIKALKAEIAKVKSVLDPTAANQRTYLDFLNTGDDGLLPNLQALQGYPPGFVSKYDPNEYVTVSGKRRRRLFSGTAFDTLSSTGLAKIPPVPPFGTLGGDILTAQDSLNTASNFGNLAVDPEPIPGAEQLGALLAEFNQAQRLQRAISSITGIAISSFLRAPFGGSFDQGGTVPGPIGAPRMIIAHGGEVVTPFDEIQSSAATVNETHVHISGKDGWLNNVIDARVEHRTRQQAGRAQRARPGRPGAI